MCPADIRPLTSPTSACASHRELSQRALPAPHSRPSRPGPAWLRARPGRTWISSCGSSSILSAAPKPSIVTFACSRHFWQETQSMTVDTFWKTDLNCFLRDHHEACAGAREEPRGRQRGGASPWPVHGEPRGLPRHEPLVRPPRSPHIARRPLSHCTPRLRTALRVPIHPHGHLYCTPLFAPASHGRAALRRRP
eukprot:scaffold1228_cov115-Isochrysis_galbana.AAC.19